MKKSRPKSEIMPSRKRMAADRKSTQREEAEHTADRLTLLHQQQADVLAKMANCAPAEYPALAREYSRLQYSIEREETDNEAAQWRKDAAARESRIVTNYGQFKLNK